MTVCLIIFGQSNISKGNQKQNTNKISIDTSVIAVLPFATKKPWIFKGNKQVDLTMDDLQNIETILIKSINDYNIEKEKEFNKINDNYPEYKLDKKNFIIDLTRYKRQYIATINSKGAKEIWINCFCRNRNLDWRRETVTVKDGGNCYFNLKINLKTGQYYDLTINGEA